MDRFAEQLLAWFETHGRHDLPWQANPTPYRVWVSEIMLQQTQVQTVVPYYERFMTRFAEVQALAGAKLDEVLGLWSGLGYYARARNLHRSARVIVQDYAGQLPESLEALLALPGIGRSTASAILALARGLRLPILDGNVKRVLARYHAVSGWTGEAAVERELWSHADAHTPGRRVREYTQAIMDLGATLCLRREPVCDSCPVSAGCRARAAGLQASLPTPRPKRRRGYRIVRGLVIISPAGDVLLERRPEQGIWGGLYSLPELPDVEAPLEWCRRQLGTRPALSRELDKIAHAFTHFDLELTPIELRLDAAPSVIMDRGAWLWYNPATPAEIGMAAPVAAFLGRHFGNQQRQIA